MQVVLTFQLQDYKIITVYVTFRFATCENLTQIGSEVHPMLQCTSFTKSIRNNCAAMKADVGFPGRPKINFFTSLIICVANIVDFPGFIFTFPKEECIYSSKRTYISPLVYLIINKKETYQNVYRLLSISPKQFLINLYH